MSEFQEEILVIHLTKEVFTSLFIPACQISIILETHYLHVKGLYAPWVFEARFRIFYLSMKMYVNYVS